MLAMVQGGSGQAALSCWAAGLQVGSTHPVHALVHRQDDTVAVQNALAQLPLNL